MRNIPAKFARIIVVLALIVSIGAHWMILQSVAWTQMIVERTGESSLSEAVASTFDGEHPCAMCKRIAEETQKEKEPTKAPLKVKIDAIIVSRVIAFHVPSDLVPASPAHFIADSRNERPPLPPPRRA